MKRRTLLQTAAAAGAAWTTHGAWAQAAPYPTRPIKVVVPFPAGTSPDTVARLIGDKLGQAWGQPMLVDNRAGAAGGIGAEMVATSPPDGYTLLLTVSSVMTINPHVYNALRYKPLTDFAPITQLLTVPYVLCASPNAPFNTMAELVAHAKANPGSLNYASYGVGSQTQVAVEIWSKQLGIQLNHVPYATNPTTDLMAGVVSLLLEPSTTAIPLIKGNKIKAIGVSSEVRLPGLPNVPALSEYQAGLQTTAFHGLFAPHGTPAAIVARLNTEVVRILALPDVRARLADLGLIPGGGTPDALAARVNTDYVSWGRAIRELNIKLQ